MLQKDQNIRIDIDQVYQDLEDIRATFYKACKEGLLEVVNYEISVNNEVVNEKDKYGMTGLHYGLLFIY